MCIQCMIHQKIKTNHNNVKSFGCYLNSLSTVGLKAKYLTYRVLKLLFCSLDHKLDETTTMIMLPPDNVNIYVFWGIWLAVVCSTVK